VLTFSTPSDSRDKETVCGRPNVDLSQSKMKRNSLSRLWKTERGKEKERWGEERRERERERKEERKRK